MTRLSWGRIGSRYYEAGVDRGVLYVGTNQGVPWDGLINVEETPKGGESRAYYLDGVKYYNASATEEFEATITAFTYPLEFEQCDGSAQARPGLFLSQQRRKSFGFSYRTGIGNDTDGSSHGYKLHLVYNALANPSTKTSNTLSGSIEPSEFSWNVSTRPPAMSGYKRTAHIVVDSRYVNDITMSAIEDVLYGSESTISKLPTFEELLVIFDTLTDLEVTDNGDDSFNISGPNDAVFMLNDDVVRISWPSVVQVDDDTYTISS